MAEMKDSDIRWIGQIPKNWKVIRVKDAFTRKKAKAKQENPVILSLARSGVKVRDITNNEGQLAENYSDYNPVIVDDLLLNPVDLISGDNCNISRVEGVISPAYVNLRYKNGINPEFYNFYFKYQYWCKAFFAYGKGVSFENRWTLNYDTLERFPLILPPIEEQNRIVKFLKGKCAEIDALHTDIEKQIETLEEYKKSIITEAVTKGLDPDVEMKDSGISYIGNIPKHWKVTNLKYLGKCQNGISKGGEYFGNGFPFVSYGDVYKNYSIPQNVDGLIMSTKTEQNIYSVKYGDVFFTRTSETIEEIGFASTCLKSIDNSVFAGFLIRFRPTSSDLIPEFSKFYFRSNIHRKFFVKEMNLVTRASLSQNLLGRLPVLLPPLCEQQMIAKNLEKKCAEIDGAIEEKKEQLETLEQYKKSLIYEYVTGKKEVK